jgi:isopentenyl diphosphate isomerase/L-lactate dehydrogenase-like FMN-dependent dehydrogenase
VSKVDTKTTLLGHTVGSPICIAPTAMQRLANDAGEKATARGKFSFFQFGNILGVFLFTGF